MLNYDEGMKKLFRLFMALAMGWAFFSCEKTDNPLPSGGNLSFSTDTVLFDTIFTTIGSTTKNFRVYNPDGNDVQIDRIALAGGPASRYRLNINGQQAWELKNYVLPAQDSIFIFVEVTLDPNNVNEPLVVQDSVVFESGSQTQDVDLVAFGQDVHLINGEIVETAEWKNDKPYLVYNSMAVDTAETLTIHPGTRIHFHSRSSMLVYGTLKALGTYEEPIYFLGDRLESFYEDDPGQWGAYVELEDGGLYLLAGIHFIKGSSDNEIRHAVIKNAIKGIQVDSMVSASRPTLTLSNTRVENMTVTGLDARSTMIVADNCVFANCGTHCVALFLGGAYAFYHCTISNSYVKGARTHPALVLNNFYTYEGQAYVFDLVEAVFANCIIDGPRQMEIEFWNTLDDVPVPGEFSYLFDHCLVKVDTLNTSDTEKWVNVYKNYSPGLDSLRFSYQLDSLSFARDKGSLDYARYFPLDLLGNSRLDDDGPDLGAYERIDQ